MNELSIYDFIWIIGVWRTHKNEYFIRKSWQIKVVDLINNLYVLGILVWIIIE